MTAPDPQGLGTIINDDAAKVQVSEVEVAVSEAGATDSYAVVLGEQPSDAVTIAFLTDAQVEAIGSLTFTPADWDVPQAVMVAAVDDGEVEGKHVSVIGHSVSSPDSRFDGIDLGFIDVTATIDDDDVGLTFSAGARSPTNPVPAGPGDTDVVVLQVEVSSSDVGVDVTLEAATLAVSQTVVDEIAARRIDALKLYRDANADGQVDAGDVLLAVATDQDAGDGSLDIALDQPLTIAVGSTVTLLVAYDFADGTTSGLPGGLLIALALPLGLLRRPRRRITVALALLMLFLASCATPTIPQIRTVVYGSTLEQVTTDADPGDLTLAGLPLPAANVSFTP